MRKLEVLSAFGWCIAGLLATRMILRVPRVESQPLVESIRASCELPAGTVVFVVRDSLPEAP